MKELRDVPAADFSQGTHGPRTQPRNTWAADMSRYMGRGHAGLCTSCRRRTDGDAGNKQRGGGACTAVFSSESIHGDACGGEAVTRSSGGGRRGSSGRRLRARIAERACMRRPAVRPAWPMRSGLVQQLGPRAGMRLLCVPPRKLRRDSSLGAVNYSAVTRTGLEQGRGSFRCYFSVQSAPVQSAPPSPSSPLHGSTWAGQLDGLGVRAPTGRRQSDGPTAIGLVDVRDPKSRSRGPASAGAGAGPDRGRSEGRGHESIH